MPRLIACMLLLLVSAAARATPPDSPAGPPEWVLLGGKVFTGDAAQPCVTAVAIAGQRVLAVGDDAAMRALAGPRTRVVELGGRVVVPGFNDAHAHVAVDRGGVRLEFGERNQTPAPECTFPTSHGCPR